MKENTQLNEEKLLQFHDVMQTWKNANDQKNMINYLSLGKLQNFNWSIINRKCDSEQK